MPGLVQRGFGVSGGVGSPVGMAIVLMHVRICAMYGESLAKCCLTVVGVCLILSKIITVSWLLMWVTGEGIGSSIVCTLEPLGSEIVTHDLRLQTARVFNLVQVM